MFRRPNVNRFREIMIYDICSLLLVNALNGQDILTMPSGRVATLIRMSYLIDLARAACADIINYDEHVRAEAQNRVRQHGAQQHVIALFPEDPENPPMLGAVPERRGFFDRLTRAMSHPGAGAVATVALALADNVRKRFVG